MTTARTGAALAVLCACGIMVSGCGSNDDGGAPADADLGVEIPTQAEADTEAAAEINEQNMDEVLEQLERDIDAELGQEG